MATEMFLCLASIYKLIKCPGGKEEKKKEKKKQAQGSVEVHVFPVIIPSLPSQFHLTSYPMLCPCWQLRHLPPPPMELAQEREKRKEKEEGGKRGGREGRRRKGEKGKKV